MLRFFSPVAEICRLKPWRHISAPFLVCAFVPWMEWPLKAIVHWFNIRRYSFLVFEMYLERSERRDWVWVYGVTDCSGLCWWERGDRISTSAVRFVSSAAIATPWDPQVLLRLSTISKVSKHCVPFRKWRDNFSHSTRPPSQPQN